ncbi:hypothetical protein Zm00014a_017917 [Zea mays]|uniref:Uncharacterized protein n=1 Tax=Zea mays TaxID=4577 RepID=A0A3L6DC39_MAIZE|nr:hypothetical protein Zm00014a_017917 [Zea mays]
MSTLLYSSAWPCFIAAASYRACQTLCTICWMIIKLSYASWFVDAASGERGIGGNPWREILLLFKIVT